ncbi:ferritin-like domain-containing protein [Lunatibacter salilacus]|uniref:ferritin-like domain-containing protein n=1 Tax=Lunatibacter salilacus TaxID=2483804 RepID=UPI00131B8352|nr:PA2169 family four-helix-bundle protein [Lunatibacter salilacus]
MKTKKELVHDLNDILERNHDVIQGYKDAARNVDNDVLKNFFISQAKERFRLADEIKVEISLLKGVPEKEGTFMGLFRRSWTNFKTSLNHENEREVCEACISEEEKSIREYDMLLKGRDSLSERLVAELESHKALTQKAIRDLKAIKEKF